MLLAAGLLAAMVIAWRLEPSPAGLGTHRALGLPPCFWMLSTGKPCPTCGMTTSFSLLAHGRVWDSARCQPMGFLAALLTPVLFWGAAISAVSGARLDRLVTPVLTRPRFWWALGGLAAGAWVYKVLTYAPTA